MAWLQLEDRLLTTLAADVDAVTTTLTVVSAAGFPASTEYLLTLWDGDTYSNPKQDPGVEVVLVTNRVGTTLTVARGQQGTSGSAHSAGARVGLYWHKANATEMQDAIDLRYLSAGGPIGGGADYADFAADGQLTLHGGARVRRHIRVSAPEWKKGVVAPTEEINGVFTTLNFGGASNDECHFTLLLPRRMEADTGIGVAVDWFHEQTADVGKVNWVIEYLFAAPGEAVEGATTTITQLSDASVEDVLQRTTFLTEMTGGDEGDVLGVRLYRTGGANGDTLGGVAKMVEVHFHFIMDKLGLPV